jgi:SMC interacting uncharacterized protein involved in chromosome segregation
MEYLFAVMMGVMAFFVCLERKRRKDMENSFAGLSGFIRETLDDLNTKLDETAEKGANTFVLTEEHGETIEKMKEEDRQAALRWEARLSAAEKTLADAEELIRGHAELEREAANSEKLFQEGLANILNYGVVKNE